MEQKQKKLTVNNLKISFRTADGKKDILGNVTALAKPHTWKGKDTLAIVSLKTQFKE